MTIGWVAFAAFTYAFILCILWISAWNGHKVREDSRERSLFGSRPGVQTRSSRIALERDDDE
jgi:hypothetical protein